MRTYVIDAKLNIKLDPKKVTPLVRWALRGLLCESKKGALVGYSVISINLNFSAFLTELEIVNIMPTSKLQVQNTITRHIEGLKRLGLPISDYSVINRHELDKPRIIPINAK